MKSFIAYIVRLSGKSRIGSQGAKNDLKESNEVQVCWGFMVIMEWG